MPVFVCEKCKYRMERPKAPLRCPYCSESGTLKRIKTAADLLREVE